MKSNTKYYLLVLVFIFKTSSLFAQQLEKKEVDSLLDVATNNAYENPNKTIEAVLPIYENAAYSKKIRTRALITLCLAYNSKRDYKKALEYIIEANEFSNQVNDKKLKIKILFMTGVQYQQLKIFDKAIEYMEEVEKKILVYPQRDSVGSTLASSYLVKGFIYKDNLNCNIALEFFNKALKEFDRLGSNAHNRSIGYYNKGNCHIILSEYEEAKESFSKSIELAKQKNANSLVSFAEKGIAEVYTLEGKYEEAIVLLESALEKSKEVEDLILNQAIYRGLFENNLALNHWEQYEKYHQLFVKTHLVIKASERNSVSISIEENSEKLNEELQTVQSNFKTNIELIILIGVILIIGIVLLEIRNRKTLKALQEKIDTPENTQSLVVEK